MSMRPLSAAVDFGEPMTAPFVDGAPITACHVTILPPTASSVDGSPAIAETVVISSITMTPRLAPIPDVAAMNADASKSDDDDD